jgi:TonB family protein
MSGMNIPRKALAAVFLTINLLSAQTRQIPSTEASRHLKKKVDAVYPQMAQIAHIQGDVVVRVMISETGEVTNVLPVTGHPLLTQSVLAAVKQWRYSPFKVDGRSVPVETLVLIAFPSTLSAKTPESVHNEDPFYQALFSCTVQIASNQSAKAEPLCRRALELSSKLGPGEQLERIAVHKALGHALLAQGKLTEALENFQEELSIVQKAGEDHGDELAGAYRDIADAMWSSGNRQGAGENYEKTESIYRRLCKSASSESEQNKCAVAFWHVLRDHADVLRQMGQPTAADLLDQEAAGIVVKSGPPE